MLQKSSISLCCAERHLSPLEVPLWARHSTEIIEFFSPLFRRGRSTKQFCSATKPFCDLAQISGNSGWLSDCQQNGGDRRHPTGDSQMRTISCVLAFAFILAGPSIAGSTDNSLPGIGSFSYNGSPVTIQAPQSIVVAAN
jgi:hypothetical protein